MLFFFLLVCQTFSQMQIDGYQKPNMHFEKGWSEESWLFLVVLLQKLKEFSVLNLYRNLMALNRRALITVTGWAEGPTALANSWTAAEFQSWARVCLFFESGILGMELLAAGAQESSATFTNQSVTIAEKNSSGGMCVSNLKPKRLPGAVSALCWGLEQMDLAELLDLADQDWEHLQQQKFQWVGKTLEQSRLWSHGLSPGHAAWLIIPVYNLRLCLQRGFLLFIT